MAMSSKMQNSTMSSFEQEVKASVISPASKSYLEEWDQKILRVATFLKEQSSTHPLYKDKPWEYWLALAETSPNL